MPPRANGTSTRRLGASTRRYGIHLNPLPPRSHAFLRRRWYHQLTRHTNKYPPAVSKVSAFSTLLSFPRFAAGTIAARGVLACHRLPLSALGVSRCRPCPKTRLHQAEGWPTSSSSGPGKFPLSTPPWSQGARYSDRHTSLIPQAPGLRAEFGVKKAPDRRMQFPIHRHMHVIT